LSVSVVLIYSVVFDALPTATSMADSYRTEDVTSPVHGTHMDVCIIGLACYGTHRYLAAL